MIVVLLVKSEEIMFLISLIKQMIVAMLDDSLLVALPVLQFGYT